MNLSLARAGALASILFQGISNSQSFTIRSTTGTNCLVPQEERVKARGSLRDTSAFLSCPQDRYRYHTRLPSRSWPPTQLSRSVLGDREPIIKSQGQASLASLISVHGDSNRLPVNQLSRWQQSSLASNVQHLGKRAARLGTRKWPGFAKVSSPLISNFIQGN